MNLEMPLRPGDDKREPVTLRDVYAGLALAALIAEPRWEDGTLPVASRLCNHTNDEAQNFAHAAFVLADAMLAQRSKQPTSQQGAPDGLGQ